MKWVKKTKKRLSQTTVKSDEKQSDNHLLKNTITSTVKKGVVKYKKSAEILDRLGINVDMSILWFNPLNTKSGKSIIG